MDNKKDQPPQGPSLTPAQTLQALENVCKQIDEMIAWKWVMVQDKQWNAHWEQVQTENKKDIRYFIHVTLLAATPATIGLLLKLIKPINDFLALFGLVQDIILFTLVATTIVEIIAKYLLHKDRFKNGFENFLAIFSRKRRQLIKDREETLFKKEFQKQNPLPPTSFASFTKGMLKKGPTKRN